MATEPVLRIEKLSKGYQGLRPLRVSSLSVSQGERVSISNVDAPAAELMINLITGAAVPDQGDVWTFGRRTADIADADDWLTWLDNFGIVSERGVLLEAATLEQNLALPFTLEIEPVPPDVKKRVAALAGECGLAEALLPVAVSDLAPDARMRVNLARAVALSPRLLLIEHPTGRVAEAGRAALAADMASVCERRHLTVVVLTNDDVFAQGVAARNLRLDAATGELRPLKRGWFGR